MNREQDKKIAEWVKAPCGHYKCKDGFYLEFGAHEWFRQGNYNADGEQPLRPCDHFPRYTTSAPVPQNKSKEIIT